METGILLVFLYYFFLFKSYYVVWKPFGQYVQRIDYRSLNRTM